MRAVRALATPGSSNAAPGVSMVRNSRRDTRLAIGDPSGSRSVLFTAREMDHYSQDGGHPNIVLQGMAAIAGMRMPDARERDTMAKLPLTFACGLYDRMLALYTGEVKPDGIDLNFLAIDDPRQIFDRRGKNLEFDACELTRSEAISGHAAGRREMVALPVFPSRVFRHGFITVNRKAVKTPKDLEGKRIGVPLYTQTAALFIRGLLQDESGVDLSAWHWLQGATNSAESHGHPSAPPLLKPVSIEQNTSGRSLSELLETGEIQAILGSGLPVALRTNPDVQRLFPDFPAIQLHYYRRPRAV